MMKTILGGYLPGTNSCRYHPITNILIKCSELYEKFDIIMNDAIIESFQNIDKEYKIEINQDNNYNIVLTVNDKTIYSQKQLYCFKINLHLNKMILEDLNFVEFLSGYIYDC